MITNRSNKFCAQYVWQVFSPTAFLFLHSTETTLKNRSSIGAMPQRSIRVHLLLQSQLDCCACLTLEFRAQPAPRAAPLTVAKSHHIAGPNQGPHKRSSNGGFHGSQFYRRACVCCVAWIQQAVDGDSCWGSCSLKLQLQRPHVWLLLRPFQKGTAVSEKRRQLHCCQHDTSFLHH